MIPEVRFLGVPVVGWAAIANFVVAALLLLLHKQTQRQNLFDKRFEVYTEVTQFIVTVARTNGCLSMMDLGNFCETVRRAKFLFRSDVTRYLDELQEKAGDVFVKAQENTRVGAVGQLDGAINTLVRELTTPVLAWKEKAFRPYLKVHSWWL
jgi:hypothetical protein